MSKTPQNKPVQPDDEDSGYGYDDYDEPDSKPPPKSQAKQQAKPQAKSQTNSRQAQPIPERRPSSTYRPRSVERRRDPYPILIGAIIGVAVIGVVLIAYLLGMKAGSSNGPAALIPAAAADTPTEPAPEDSVPRISMADFIKLYSSPTDRPYIIDVRPKDSYDQAHIKGAVSIPEDQITGHLGDLPKGKLIVTYCDWDNEEESARVALTLYSSSGYNFTTDNVKVLKGGWAAWVDNNSTNPSSYPVEEP